MNVLLDRAKIKIPVMINLVHYARNCAFCKNTVVSLWIHKLLLPWVHKPMLHNLQVPICLKGLAMLFAGHENPLIILFSSFILEGAMTSVFILLKI